MRGLFWADSCTDFESHQKLSTSSLSRGIPLRRRQIRKNRESLLRLQPALNEKFWGGKPFAMPGAIDAGESECHEKIPDVEAWEPNDPASGEFTHKVWMFSGSLTHVTEIVVDIS